MSLKFETKMHHPPIFAVLRCLLNNATIINLKMVNIEERYPP